MKTVLITGCSTGLGRDLAEVALDQGFKVIATARKPEVLQDLQAKGAKTCALDVDKPRAELLRFADEIIAEQSVRFLYLRRYAQTQ